MIDYKFLVKVTPVEGLSYYFRTNKEVIEYMMDTEVGPKIEAIYSLDLVPSSLQFYRVDLEMSEKGKKVNTKIYRISTQT